MDKTGNISDFRQIVARNIKEARKKKKLTQQQLANIIGKHESSIRKYEKGLTDIPNEVIQQIATALDTSPAELLSVNEWNAKFNPGGKLSKEVQTIEQIQSVFGENAVKLLETFNKLNELGRVKALSELEDLIEVPKYQKKDV